jgi:hypothetical protein
VAEFGRWVAEFGRWVAEFGRWMNEFGRWVAEFGRWMNELLAHLLATAGLWVRIQTFLKNTKWAGDISKEVANTL